MRFRTLPTLLTLFIASAAGLTLPRASGAPASPWTPVPAEELSATQPEIEADAPAEVIAAEITFDDRGYPTVCRTRDYVRLKIFDTTNIESITRIAERWNDDDTEIEIRARLTLPDGTTAEFGRDDIKERTLAKSGRAPSLLDRITSGKDAELKEKFLAITGIRAGAVLEMLIERKAKADSTVTIRSLQRSRVPIRKLTYTHIAPPNDTFEHRLYLLNPTIGGAKLAEDRKKRTTTITATRIPSLVDEPLAGPFADYVLAVLSSYELKQGARVTRGNALSVNIDPRKHGQWAPIAAREYVSQEGQSPSTARTRQLAKELTASAPTREAGAARIHDFVADLYQGFRLRQKTGLQKMQGAAGSLDDVLDWKARHELWYITDQDFRYLAYALFRDAGYEACTLLVPDRRLVRFDQGLVSDISVNLRCVGVKIGEAWHFSEVTSAQKLPFDMLPWFMEGQAALRAKDGREEFVGVPYTPAEKSIVTTSGTLRLDVQGMLSGTLTRKYIGHAAWLMRDRGRDQPPARQLERFRDALREDLGFDEIVVTETRGPDDIAQPLEIVFDVREAGFATLTGDRLIVRANPLRMTDTSPFTRDTRIANIQFPFAWGESDRIVLELPEGFRPEALPATRPLRNGQFFAHAMQAKFDAGRGALQLRREFAVMDWFFEAKDYPGIKGWFDSVATSDSSELVLTRTPAAP